MKNKEVLILFKTHLDVGFTDYSESIIEKYLNTYIPNAIRVGYELKETDTPFIWTVGSWLINEALKRDADGSVERAVRDGILSWHALPFTTHTELMNTELFEYALDISESLDKRFGKKNNRCEDDRCSRTYNRYGSAYEQKRHKIYPYRCKSCDTHSADSLYLQMEKGRA